MSRFGILGPPEPNGGFSVDMENYSLWCIEGPAIKASEPAHVRWILTNYYEFNGSIYDLLEINCEESKKSLRTKYRRAFNQFMGKDEVDSYEYITDWIYPEDGSNYMIEIERICGLLEETEDSVDD